MQADAQAAFAQLNTTVAGLTTVQGSLIALLNGQNALYKAALATQGDDSDVVAAVQAANTAATDLATQAEAAVLANTPAAPTPVPAP